MSEHVDLVIQPDDPRLRWRGHWSLERRGEFIAPWRVPHTDANLYFPVGGHGRAAMTAGVRLSVETDSPTLGMRYATTPPTYDSDPPEWPHLDVLCNGELYQTLMLERETGGALFEVSGMPPVMKRIEMWLPVYWQVRLGTLSLASGSRVAAACDRQPIWTHFGCSISQGRGASSPSQTFLAQTARAIGADLRSLSMGAVCLLQPMFAKLVAQPDSDLISIHAGSNIYYYGALNRETLETALIGFINILRELRPTTPIVVISPTFAPTWESKPGPSKMTHARVRQSIRSAFNKLVAHGYQGLHYLDGLDLFGPEDTHNFLEPMEREPIHFNRDGHDLVAVRLTDWLRSQGFNFVPNAQHQEIVS